MKIELVEGKGGLTKLRLVSDLSMAEVYLQGAHLTAFQPAGAAPLLFVSPDSLFAAGTPIRGGVPVCFPWFAGREHHPDSPSHGFARTALWDVESVSGNAQSGFTAVFRLGDSPATRALWPQSFTARLRFAFTNELQIEMEVGNTSAAPFTFEQALHTYFSVSDVRHVTLRGLEGASYLDKTDQLRRKTLLATPLRFEGETDAIFPGSTSSCVIHDPGFQRDILVEKTNSRTTVVWNPWSARAAALPDLADDSWPEMLCVESANIGADAVSLAPGGMHTMTLRIQAQPLST